MGISFVYIGRDATTLKDKLPVEKLGDQLPIELGGGSAFGMYRSNTTKSPIALPAILGPDPNSITELEAPLPPMKTPAFSLGGNSSSIFGQMLNPSNPTTQKMMEMMLPSLLPSLPKGFKLSDVFPPGGIVTSNMEVLFEAVQKDHPSWLSAMPKPLFKQPAKEGADHQEGGHRAVIRAIYGLDK
jgi:hypothetical protein